MSVINLSLKHGQTLEEARGRLDVAVGEVRKLLGNMVQRVAWNAERDRVRIEGTGFWVEMSVDAQDLHATGDIPALAGLLGGPLTAGLKRVVQQTFQKQLR
jgi:hypothetical protein